MRNALLISRQALCVWLLCLFSTLSLQAQNTISGTVTDGENNETLPGVNVLVKGTTIGTITDVEGKYALSIPADAETLVFSSVGYTAEEVSISNRSTIDMVMIPDIQSLSEVVVVGYGAQEKKDITGAISSVSAQDINEVPVANPAQALQGRAPGVDVVNLGNRPGQGVQVRIRGRRSFIAGNEPLYVLMVFLLVVILMISILTIFCQWRYSKMLLLLLFMVLGELMESFLLQPSEVAKGGLQSPTMVTMVHQMPMEK